MGNSLNFKNLRAALDDLPRISKIGKSGGMKPTEARFNHKFSQENGLRIKSVHPGHVEADLKADERHFNRHSSVHGGLLTTAADAVMAAVAQSNAGRKDGKLEVVRDFAMRFHEPVLPGQALEIVSQLDSSRKSSDGEKEIKFITSEIREGSGNHSRLVGQALSSYIMVGRGEYLGQAA